MIEREILAKEFRNRTLNTNSIVRVLFSSGRLNEVNETALASVGDMQSLIRRIVRLGGTVGQDGSIIWLDQRQ